MRQQPLKVGIIGLGLFFNKRHWPAIRSLNKKFDIKAVYSSSATKFRLFQKECPQAEHIKDLDQLLQQDIDMVVACLPITQMFAVAQKVLKAKKHLVLSKPFTKNSHQAKQLLTLARKAKVKIFVTENFRYLSSIRKLKALLETPRLGPVRMIQVDFINSFDLTSPYAEKGAGWRINPKEYYGILLDGGIHIICALRFLFRDFKLKYRHLSSHNPYLGKYDTAHFHLLIDKIDAFMTITYAMKKKGFHFLKIFCAQGVYHLSKDEVLVEKNYKIIKSYRFTDDEYVTIYKSVYHDIRQEPQTEFSAQEAYQDMLLFEKLFINKKA